MHEGTTYLRKRFALRIEGSKPEAEHRARPCTRENTRVIKRERIHERAWSSHNYFREFSITESYGIL